VNQRYVIATSTNVPVTGVDVSKIDDAFFAREKTAEKEGEEALFDAKAPKATVTSPARKAAQEAVDAKLKANVEGVKLLADYLAAKFTLSKADRPHLIKF
jgi:large subunit ribosomal protein L6e